MDTTEVSENGGESDRENDRENGGDHGGDHGGSETVIVGWRELVRLPDLDTRAFRAKFDTGARTSALHAEDIREVSEDGVRMVHFLIDRPRVKGDVHRTVPIFDHRMVTSSNGEEEMRYVIETDFQVGSFHYPIELTLTQRGDMRYPMLVGRKALAGRLLIDPSRGYLQGRPPRPGEP